MEQIKQELFKNITSFVSEIELCFDYVDTCKINKYIENIKKSPERFDKFVSSTCVHLKFFEKDICFVLFGKQKVKSEQYDFVNNICLFGDNEESCLLSLSVFKDENKNTKKSFLKYVYNIYMSSLFIATPDETQLTEELRAYVDKVSKEIAQATQATQATQAAQNQAAQPKRSAIHSVPDGVPAGMPSMASMMGMMGGMMGGGGAGMPAGLESMMSSILGNKDILNIATEISEQMKNEQMNPMAMISDLMSGKPDSRLNNLVSRVQENVESKISSGEINKELFEEQAKSIIQTVHNSDVDLGVPGMLSNLMNDMKGMSGENAVNEEELEKFIKELESKAKEEIKKK